MRHTIERASYIHGSHLSRSTVCNSLDPFVLQGCQDISSSPASTESILAVRKQSVPLKMVDHLRVDDAFHYLREDREKRHWAVVGRIRFGVLFNTGTTCTNFQLHGRIPHRKDSSKSLVTAGASSREHSFRTRVGRPSGPVALQGLRLASRRWTSDTRKWIRSRLPCKGSVLGGSESGDMSRSPRLHFVAKYLAKQLALSSLEWNSLLFWSTSSGISLAQLRPAACFTVVHHPLSVSDPDVSLLRSRLSKETLARWNRAAQRLTASMYEDLMSKLPGLRRQAVQALSFACGASAHSGAPPAWV